MFIQTIIVFWSYKVTATYLVLFMRMSSKRNKPRRAHEIVGVSTTCTTVPGLGVF